MARWMGILAAAGLAVPALATDWDESIDGDLSTDESNPTMIDLTVGSNVITGTIGGSSTNSPPEDFFDAFTISVGAGETLEAINVLSYVTAGGNSSSGVNFADGTSWNGDFTAPNFIGSVTLTTSLVGSDLLDENPDLGGALGPGDYVIALREGTPGQTYSLDLVLVPSPGVGAAVGLGLLVGLRRRR